MMLYFGRSNNKIQYNILLTADQTVDRSIKTLWYNIFGKHDVFTIVTFFLHKEYVKTTQNNNLVT